MRLKEYFDYTKYAEILHLTKFELAFCLGYFVLALIICIYSTPRGSLFSPDSINYVLQAESFFRIFPVYAEGPVYPLLIAIGMALGLTSEQSAGIVPIICYSVLGLPLFLLSKIISRPITGYLTCIITLLCGKYLLYISTYAWTDMPYLLISVLAVLFLAIYNKYGSLCSITLAGIFTLAAELTRVIGITLFLAGIIVILANWNRAKIKRTLISLTDYCVIAAAPFFIWTLISEKTKWLSLNSPKNPPIDVMILKFRTVIEQIFYLDYKALMIIIVFASLLIIIYLAFRKQLIDFIKDTIPLNSYIVIYSTVLILVTSSFWISVGGGALDIRKVVQIYPYIILLITSLVIVFYDRIDILTYKNVFKAISIILLIGLVAQGVGPLYSQASSIRTQSLNEYSDKLGLNKYIHEYNITNKDIIYFDVSNGYINHLRLALGQRTPKFYTRFIKGTNSKTTILDNLTLPNERTGPASATSILDLIRDNKNHSIGHRLSPPLSSKAFTVDVRIKCLTIINPCYSFQSPCYSHISQKER